MFNELWNFGDGITPRQGKETFYLGVILVVIFCWAHRIFCNNRFLIPTPCLLQSSFDDRIIIIFVTSWYFRVCCILMPHLRHSLQVEVDVVGLYVGWLIISMTSTSPFIVLLFLGDVLCPWLLVLESFDRFKGCLGNGVFLEVMGVCLCFLIHFFCLGCLS